MSTNMSTMSHSSLRSRSQVLQRIFKTMSPAVLAAFITIIILFLLAILTPLITPYNITEQSLLNRLKPPVFLDSSSDYLLGTDHLGRDVFSRLLYALRTTLTIAVLGVIIGILTGTISGLISGTVGGWTDSAFMLLVDVQTSMPLTLLALTAVAIIGTSPLVLVLIVGIADYNKYARLVRGQVMAIKERSFVEAASALGASPWRIILRHILPNIVSPLLVLATINLSRIIILESALSFLGVGVQPPNTSLGQMLGEARNYLIVNSWLAVIPSIVIIMITMSMSLIGDWLRDAFDPNRELNL